MGAQFLEPLMPLFRRPSTSENFERYCTGLLTDLPRKTCDGIAAAVAGTTVERLQHLLTDADWDPVALLTTGKSRKSKFRTDSTDGDAEDGNSSGSKENNVPYWATNNLEMTEEKREELARRAWGVET